MRFQLSFSHKYFLQPGDEETTVTASTLNEMDREQYETMFADVLISYELLEIGESIGEGRHRTICSKSCYNSWVQADLPVIQWKKKLYVVNPMQAAKI